MGADWTEDVSRLQPVLVVTQHRADANLVMEQLRGFASTIITLWAQTTEAVWPPRRSRSPGLLIVEQAPPPLDGLAFVRSLRRSSLSCREAPVIMMTSQPTLRATCARRAERRAAHEFLVRPFSAHQLAKRLEAVAAPRPWLETATYAGPDRRRFNSAALLGPDRRRGRRPAKTPVSASS